MHCSDTHCIAVDSEGSAWTWGKQALGREGSGAVPAKVPGLEAHKLVAGACGRAHTLALTQDGKVLAWGRGPALGTPTDSDKPALVSLPSKVAQVAAGSNFSLLRTAEGELLSCGTNDFGQLGQGTTAARHIREPRAIRSLSGAKVAHAAAGVSSRAVLFAESR